MTRDEQLAVIAALRSSLWDADYENRCEVAIPSESLRMLLKLIEADAKVAA